MKEVSMMKKNHLLKLSLTILTVCFAFLLVACGQKEEVTYYQRIDQSNQFDMRLTYYHKGDIVTKQTTENFISYKSLGIDESQEEQKNAAKAKIEELSKQYQTVKGIKEKVSFDKNGIKENIEIDYDKADLKELASLPGMMISNEKNAKKISMKASGEALEKSGFKKVENGKFEELKK
jgi:uncharacterized lipoprotein lin0239